jgi:ribosome-associated protein
LKRTKYLAKRVIKYALEKKAEEVILLDLRKISPPCDFFVICTGMSDAHVRAIADSVIDECKKNKVDIYHVEGNDSYRWVLIDFVDVVLHIFQPEVRDYYQLERLWGDAPKEIFGQEEEEAKT